MFTHCILIARFYQFSSFVEKKAPFIMGRSAERFEKILLYLGLVFKQVWRNSHYLDNFG